MKSTWRRRAAAAYAVCAFLATSQANAGYQTGTIKQVVLISGGASAYIKLSTSTVAKDACHTSSFDDVFVFSVTTNEGKALLSTAQAALLSGRTVFVYGTAGNACSTVTILTPVGSGSHTIEVLGQLALM